jgi:hypothetical protein
MQVAYDGARQRVVMFGGAVGGGETWLWDGVNWAQALPAASPQVTGNSAMAYDAARQEVVLFGNYGQTWIWNGTNWVQRGSLTVPAARSFPVLVYDPVRQKVVMFSGSNYQDTWLWDGVNWTQAAPSVSPTGMQYHRAVWDGARQRVVLFGGDVANVDNYSADTWLWDGTTWVFWSGKTQTFDMTGRASGVWNFTTINVPPSVTVRFKKNAQNTPVRWLATGNVQIDGTIDLNGSFGANALAPGISAAGGPGGYDGGRGGVAFNSSASYAGTPGQGPGGGLPGTSPQTSPTNLRDAGWGSYNGTTTTYGNVYLQPLLGGSGGGGGASSDTSNGGNGGGGGGAILIASSLDIFLNGLIRANGGDREYGGGSYGGVGSGGAILLRADRVTGAGTLQAYAANTGTPNGRIRVEAYVRSMTGSRVPAEVVALPAANGELNQLGTLTVVSVDGVNVVQPPSGNLQTPDVVFSDSGPVTVVVQGSGLLDGTPVRLRVTTGGSVIEAGPQNLVGNAVSFTVTVPAGVGTVQAIATVTQP